MTVVYVPLLLVLLYGLSKVSDITADSVRRLGTQARINEFIASFFLLGLATSVPELAVALFSAFHGVPELSLGNLLGANIVVLTLLIGLAAVFSGKISTHGVLRKKDFLLSLIITGLPILFVLDGYLSRLDGMWLVASYFYFIFLFYQQWPSYSRRAASLLTRRDLTRNLTIFIGSVAALLVLSHFLVQVSLNIAAHFGIPLLIIGLLMIAVGTNVPELPFVIKQAARRNDRGKGMVTGVLLGNTVVNTPILGVLALLQPFAITNVAAVRVTSVFLLIVLLLLAKLMISGKRLTRREGLVLIGLYILFLLYQLGSQA